MKVNWWQTFIGTVALLAGIGGTLAATQSLEGAFRVAMFIPSFLIGIGGLAAVVLALYFPPKDLGSRPEQRCAGYTGNDPLDTTLVDLFDDESDGDHNGGSDDGDDTGGGGVRRLVRV